MFDKELLSRSNDENAPLSVGQEAWLDEALERQSFVSGLMKALPKEQPSLAWRSRLNERVLAIASDAKRRIRWLAILRPALGIGLAGALAIVFTIDRNVQPTPLRPKGAVEAGLVKAHEMSVEATEIAGPGLAEHEAVATEKGDDLYDWQEADLDTL